jgi:hypothetical protein
MVNNIVTKIKLKKFLLNIYNKLYSVIKKTKYLNTSWTISILNIQKCILIP